MAGVRIFFVVVLVRWIQLASGTVTNVALMKQAWMSSTINGNHSASKAVDGDTSANSFGDVSHTADGQPTSWWKVDLQTQVQSARVMLYFRTDYKARRNGVQLYTSGANSSDPKEGNLCHKVTGRPDGTDILDVLNVTCPGTWRYLTVYTETDNDQHGAILDFAEVQVWTCSAGMYGVSCNKNCNSRHCSAGSTVSCDSLTGACSSGQCQAGWAGTDCAVCLDGKYGTGCARNCSSRHCKVSSTCPHISGSCQNGGCEDGWMGRDCSTECPSGTYGTNCNRACGHCANNNTCHHVTGICTGGCEAGWQLTTCQEVCRSGTFGTNCNRACGHCANNDTCHHVTGICAGGCEAGWQGDLCQKECSPGKYGANCAKDCSSRHCKSSSTCDRIIGACTTDGCDDGWMGPDCSTGNGEKQCPSGTHGINCNKTCGHCANIDTCHHVTGICAGGCQAGWQGDLCQKERVNCPDGRYGPGCTEFCNSRNCKTPSPVCDITGSCTDGCRGGWQNADCRIPCPSGKYGSNCSKSCDSRQCKTSRTACDHVSGACTTGCQEGWIGADCTQRCKPGTYGPDCSRCGHCDVTCNVGDGRCPGECLGGFTGDRCDQDVRASVVKIGVIGGAIGMTIMLLLVGGLFMCLLKHGRLKWVPPNGAEAREGRTTGYTDGTSTRTPTPGVKDPDYTELNDVTRDREEKSPYDVI